MAAASPRPPRTCMRRASCTATSTRTTSCVERRRRRAARRLRRGLVPCRASMRHERSQRIEARAFGCLLEELLARCGAADPALGALQARCVQPTVALRPGFAEIGAQTRRPALKPAPRSLSAWRLGDGGPAAAATSSCRGTTPRRHPHGHHPPLLAQGPHGAHHRRLARHRPDDRRGLPGPGRPGLHLGPQGRGLRPDRQGAVGLRPLRLAAGRRVDPARARRRWSLPTRSTRTRWTSWSTTPAPPGARPTTSSPRAAGTRWWT